MFAARLCSLVVATRLFSMNVLVVVPSLARCACLLVFVFVWSCIYDQDNDDATPLELDVGILRGLNGSSMLEPTEE